MQFKQFLHLVLVLFSVGYWCPPGQTDDLALPCLVGHYCPPGSPVPIFCPTGTYQDKQKQANCTICESGKLQLSKANCDTLPHFYFWNSYWSLYPVFYFFLLHQVFIAMRHLGLQIYLSCSLVQRDITVLKELVLPNNFHALPAPITPVSSWTAKVTVCCVRQDITVQILDLKNL